MIDCYWSWNLNQQNPLVCCSSWQQLFPVSQLGIQHCSCGGLWIFGSGLKVLVHAEAWRGDQGSWRHLQLSKFDFWTRHKQLFWAHLAWTAILAPVTASSSAWMSNGLHHMAMIWPITGAIAIETKVDVYLNKLGWCFLFNPNSSVMLNRLSFFLQLCIKWKDVNGRSHSVSRKQKLTPGYKVRKNSFVPYSRNSPPDTRLERILSSFILCLFFLITVIFRRALALGDKLVTLSSVLLLLLVWRCKRERQEENGLDRQEKTRSELIQVEEIIRVMADSHGDVSNYGNTTCPFSKRFQNRAKEER